MTQWGLDTLFNPAKRHMDEEKRRLQSTREEVGDNSGGKRIDLESGKVTIRRQDSDDPESEEVEQPGEIEDASGAAAKDREQSAADHPAGKPEAEPLPPSCARRSGAGGRLADRRLITGDRGSPADGLGRRAGSRHGKPPVSGGFTGGLRGLAASAPVGGGFHRGLDEKTAGASW